MGLDFLGPVIVLGLGCLGSCIGCGITGMACHGVMSRVEEGHGKLLGMSAAPASQCIYGFILMILMKQRIEAGTLSPTASLAIAIGAGLAFMFSSIYQAKCAVTGMQAAAKKPEVYGKCFATLGIVESFALFSFVFSLLLM